MEKYCRESWKWETRLENEDSMDNSDDRSGNTDQTESVISRVKKNRLLTKTTAIQTMVSYSLRQKVKREKVVGGRERECFD